MACASLRSMINALKNRNLYNDTLFIVTAKHGQSPINPQLINKVGHFADLVAALTPANGTEAAAQAAVAAANNCSPGLGSGAGCGFVQDDDIALIWLAAADQSKAQSVRMSLDFYSLAWTLLRPLAGSVGRHSRKRSWPGRSLHSDTRKVRWEPLFLLYRLAKTT